MFEEILNMKSSWEILQNTELPIVVYGTGNGADKVFAEFDRLGIKAYGVMASNEFVRNRSFHCFQVKSISQFETELDDFVIALAFASPLPQVIENIMTISKKHTVIMPSVPVYSNEIFNKEFLKKNLSQIEMAYTHLHDEQSKKVFENIIKFQITGNLNYAFNCETEKSEAYSLLQLSNSESFLDLGAYRGDTIDEFLSNVNNYEKILALEPDIKTYKKLAAHCDCIDNSTTLNLAVWNQTTTKAFDNDKGRGSSLGIGENEISTVTIDDIFDKYGKYSYINIDVEGVEKEALEGGKNALQTKPKICMAAYHKSEDIFLLVNLLNSINGEYKIYLRHHPHISFWDTNIYAI